MAKSIDYKLGFTAINPNETSVIIGTTKHYVNFTLPKDVTDITLEFEFDFLDANCKERAWNFRIELEPSQDLSKLFDVTGIEQWLHYKSQGPEFEHQDPKPMEIKDLVISMGTGKPGRNYDYYCTKPDGISYDENSI